MQQGMTVELHIRKKGQAMKGGGESDIYLNTVSAAHVVEICIMLPLVVSLSRIIGVDEITL